ncbi:MAG: hypothetical protein AB1714_00945 [Acidobacteriota bacterium]
MAGKQTARCGKCGDLLRYGKPTNRLAPLSKHRLSSFGDESESESAAAIDSKPAIQYPASMSGEVEIEAASEIDRERVRREIEEEIRSLDQKVAFILHPEMVELKPCATLVFGPPDERDRAPDAEVMERYGRAVELAIRAPKYWTEGEGRFLRHFARFEMEQSRALFDLYQLTSELPENEVLIHDLPLPFARDLWLPLFWFHRT